jgi:hypothetical protein
MKKINNRKYTENMRAPQDRGWKTTMMKMMMKMMMKTIMMKDSNNDGDDTGGRSVT